MNLLEISQETGISVRTLRKVVKALQERGLMPAPERIPEIAKMKNYLSIGAHLPVQSLVLLLERPELLKAMGEKAEGAKVQLTLLGDVPVGIDKDIYMPAIGAVSEDALSLEKFEAWVKATIPEKGCTHHYLAVRVAMATPPAQRKAIYGKIKYAFLKLRMKSSFAGWFTVDRDRKRPMTIYHRPKNTA